MYVFKTWKNLNWNDLLHILIIITSTVIKYYNKYQISHLKAAIKLIKIVDTWLQWLKKTKIEENKFNITK